jgi:transcriptional regulator with GAF, ATPase, and Fis domain
MSTDLIPRIREAEAALRRGDADAARQILSRLRLEASRVEQQSAALTGDVSRYRLMLERTLAVTLARGLEPLAEQILDGIIAVVGAERGFVGLVEGEGWRFLAARRLSQADIDDPASQVSTHIIREALACGEPLVTHDATQDFAGQRSVRELRLRSVAALPLRDGERRLGFVYLDNRESSGLFDEAAVSAAAIWLPVLAGCVLREQGSETALPGVLTRSAAMRAQLSELGRIVRFDVPVLLTGETGTGKSLIARQLHASSARSGRPFLHLNCGAIPEALLESELFGHRKGTFTGATADREGKFEAANGGTLFLDELDCMPIACQVKLLVALQERQITRLGDSRPVEVDVRLIAAMGRDPDVAIASGRLREDLYYRLAVFVAHLPALRERREDIPLLASHFLEQTRARYQLPPMRLSETALEELLAHDWPGNIRELGNVLDRAALLADRGVIESVRLPRGRGRGAETASTGVLAKMLLAASALLDQMEEREPLRSWDTAEAFKALVLLEAVRRADRKEDAFAALGLESLVTGRNHNRTLRREGARLARLAEILGEPLNPALAALSD